jgi:hypothetical protein
MYFNTFLLFCIALLLCLGAVIAFSIFVVKPVQTRWAVRQARKIVAGGERGNDWQLRNIRRMLATAHDDLEAVELWHEIKKVPVSASPGERIEPPIKRIKATPKITRAASGLTATSALRSSPPKKTPRPRKAAANRTK